MIKLSNLKAPLGYTEKTLRRMACEQLGRHCRTMEYDPKYCDVIITRWEKYTGRKATKID